MDFSHLDFFGEELTRAEKLLILFLSLLLFGLCYYQFFYRPITREIEQLHVQHDALSAELTQVQSRLQQLQQMKTEMDQLENASRMPSYNSIEAETTFLNDVLTAADEYSISFSNPSRNGEQVRRNVSLRFTANSYDTAQSILENLAAGEFRCLLGDLRYAGSQDSAAAVSVNLTFFETMAGGTIDRELSANS